MRYQRTKAACNYFINKARSEGLSLTPMQAIKLVYFAHGYCLGLLNHPLIDDHVEAWKFGAVIPSLYHALKKYGSMGIRAPILDDSVFNDWEWNSIPEEELAQKCPSAIISYNFSSEEFDVLDGVWEVYKGKTGIELSSYIHKPDTPWTQVWENGGKYWHGATISDELIKDYYKKKIAGNGR